MARNSPDQDRDPLVVRLLIYAATLLAALMIIPLLIAIAVQAGLLDAPLVALHAGAIGPLPPAVVIGTIGAIGAGLGLIWFRAPGWLEDRRTDLLVGVTNDHWHPQLRVTDAERDAHWLITGLPGMGKSGLLTAITVQCAGRHREALAVIDTHGTLIRDVLGLAAAAITARGSLILEGGHRAWRYGIDPLHCHPGEEPARRARAVARAFATIYGASWSDRIEFYLAGTFQALIETGFTLAEAGRFLNEADFRDHVLARCTSATMREFARTLGRKSARQFAEETGSVLVKLQGVLADPSVRALLGLAVTDAAYVRHRRARLPGYEPRVVDLFGLLATGSPILIDLNKRGAGDFARPVAGLCLATLLNAGMSRADLVENDAVERATIVADELQSYATDAVVDLIEEGRKFKLSLCGSCTALATIPPRIRDALLGARLLIAFQVTTQDAALLAGQLHRRILHRTGRRGAQGDTSVSPGDRGAWQADQLVTTAPRDFLLYSRLRGGEGRPLHTLDLALAHNRATDDAARDASGRLHGNDRAQVTAEFAVREAWLDDRLYLATPGPGPASGDEGENPFL